MNHPKELTLESQHLKGWDTHDVSVFAFHGTEEISGLYQYELGIHAPDTFSTSGAVGHHATFTYRGGGADGADLVVHGKLASIETIAHYDHHTCYKLVLVPFLWNLSLAQHSRAWVGGKGQKGISIIEVLRSVLRGWGYHEKTGQGRGAADDGNLEFRVNHSHYEPRDLVCQYNETDLAFLSRWLEREGLFYYFEQHPYPIGERLIITDQRPSSLDESPKAQVYYGKMGGHSHALDEFHGKLRAVSYGVRARDYDFTSPKPDYSAAQQKVPQQDQMTSVKDEVVLYGEHLLNVKEAERISLVRADAIASQRHVIEGSGAVRGLKAGYRFKCSTHVPGHHDLSDSDYLVTAVEHWGNSKVAGERAVKAFEKARGSMLSDLAPTSHLEEGEFKYRMRFTCIPAGPDDPHFRQPLTTPIPKIHSMVRGIATGNYEYSTGPGRIRLYEVKLDFDEQYVDVKARLVQPHGAMQFTVPANAEVVVEFLAGNVDRPIITNVAPSASTGNVDPPKGSNVIQSDTNNKLELDDNPGQQSITASSPINETYLRLGQMPDPQGLDGPWNAHLNTLGSTQFTFGQQWYVKAGQAVRHEFEDDYQMKLGRGTEDPYSLKVERVTGLAPRVTEQTGQVLRSASGSVSHDFEKDHDLHVGGQHEHTVDGNHQVAVKQNQSITIGGSHQFVVGAYNMQIDPTGAQTVTAKALSMAAGGTSVAMGNDHLVDVAKDQTVTIAGASTTIAKTHFVTAGTTYDLVVGDAQPGTYTLTVGASGMTVRPTGFEHPDGHNVTVRGGHTMHVEGAHTMLVGASHDLTVIADYSVRGNTCSVIGASSIQITSPLTIIN